MAIKFYCVCGKKIEAPDAAKGRKGKCPKCGRELVVPAVSGATPAGGVPAVAPRGPAAVAGAAARPTVPPRVSGDASTEVVSRRAVPSGPPMVRCKACGKAVPASAFDCPHCHAPVELGSDPYIPVPPTSKMAPPAGGAPARPLPAASLMPPPPPAAAVTDDFNSTVVDDVFAQARPTPMAETEKVPPAMPPAPPRPGAWVPPEPEEDTGTERPAPDADAAPAPPAVAGLHRSAACYFSFLVGAGGCLLQLLVLIPLWYVQTGALADFHGIDLRRLELHKAALAFAVTIPLALILGWVGQYATREREAYALGRPYADSGMTFALLTSVVAGLTWIFPTIVEKMPSGWR